MILRLTDHGFRHHGHFGTRPEGKHFLAGGGLLAGHADVAQGFVAHNRRGDSLLLIGQADEALEAFNAAQPLASDDAYILYNRARAHLALGDRDNARADLQAASDPKFNQPKARELAQNLLDEME